MSPWVPYPSEDELPAKRISPSLMKAADVCLHRVPFYRDRERVRTDGALRTAGTAYHAALARAYGTWQTQGAWPTLEQMLETVRQTVDECVNAIDDQGRPVQFDWHFQAKSFRNPEILWTLEDIVEHASTAVTVYFESGHMWNMDRFMVQAVEQKFTLPLDGPWTPVDHSQAWGRSGILDLVLYDMETGWDIIVDHKLTKKKWAKDKGQPSNEPAPALYHAAWRDVTGRQAVTMYFDIMGIKDWEFDRRPAPRSQEQIDLTVERAIDLAKLIDQGGPYPANPSHFLCSKAWCDYWDDCAFGKGLA